MRLGLVGGEASVDDGGGKRWVVVQPGRRHLEYAQLKVLVVLDDDEDDGKGLNG
jgi:hypothetical protein